MDVMLRGGGGGGSGDNVQLTLCVEKSICESSIKRSLPLTGDLVHRSNTEFGYNPKIASTQRLLVFSIPIEGALHKYG